MERGPRQPGTASAGERDTLTVDQAIRYANFLANDGEVPHTGLRRVGVTALRPLLDSVGNITPEEMELVAHVSDLNLQKDWTARIFLGAIKSILPVTANISLAYFRRRGSKDLVASSADSYIEGALMGTGLLSDIGAVWGASIYTSVVVTAATANPLLGIAAGVGVRVGEGYITNAAFRCARTIAQIVRR